MKRNRYEYRTDDWPSFVLMHIVFFGVQFFFFWIYFEPTPFTEWNIPVIYYRIQEIGYPIVLVCSLIWLNRHFFPEHAKFMLISVVLFVAEWFGLDRLIMHSPFFVR